MKEVVALAAIFGIAVAVVFVQGMEYQDELKEMERYCEMVDIWNSQSHLNPEDRAGWPAFKGEEICQ